MERPFQVFCCYAREDQSFLLLLKRHLKPLERRGLITLQDDIDISPGEDWKKKISHYLNTAQIILLLISSDFMDSDYCYGTEMKRALERHERGEARVIPIILRRTDWQVTPLDKLQALPKDAEPVASRFWHTPDDAFVDVVKGIRKVVEEEMIQLRRREIALFGYETQKGSSSVLWSNPGAFSLNDLYERYREWLAAKKGFTESDIINHTWVKVGDSGNSYVIYFLSNGQLFDENPLTNPSKQRQGSWQIIDGILRTTIEQNENDTLVKYELDIIANKNGLMYSGIESNSQGTAHNYFVFLPSSPTTNHLEEAIRAYDQLLQVNQTCVDAYKTKGNLLRDLERYEEALNAYQRATEMKLDYMWAWYDTGDILHKLKRYDEAIIAFNHAIALDHKNAWAWHEKGQTLYDLKRYNEALAAYNQATEFDPNNACFWHHKGETLRKLRQYEEALVSYEQALKVDPKFAKSYNGMGNVLYRNLKRYKEAVAAYQQAIELRPDYMWAWQNLGNVFYRLRRFEDALGAYKRTTEIDPSHFWAWHNMGDVLYELEHLEEAVVAFDHAINRDKQVATTWRKKGKALQDLQRYEEALASYERALELESRHALTWINKGQVLRILQRYEEALTAYDRTLQLEANDIDAYLGKGRVYLDLGRYNDALDIYEQATNIAPTNTWTWHDKGIALGNLQRPEEAMEAFEHAIELDPENKWAWLHKAETLIYLAQQAYKKAGQPGGEPLKREYYNLVQKATGRCLDGNDKAVYMHDLNGGDFQLWKAIEISPNIIILKHFRSGKVLEATEQKGTYLSEYTNSPSQQWIPEDVGHGYKKFRQVATGMVLHGDADNDVYLQPNGGDFQIWRAIKIHITPLITSHDASNSVAILVFEQ